MFVFGLLSIGAIYALIPVIIILILIAAAAGLRGGTDLFTLLGFGTIIQAAQGFGAGGAGKGISKSNEYKETMSNASPTGAKVRIAQLGPTVKGAIAKGKANKENAILTKTDEGKAAVNKVKAAAITSAVTRFVRDAGKKDVNSLSHNEREALKKMLKNMERSPREYLIEARRTQLETRNRFQNFMTNTTKNDARTAVNTRPFKVGRINLIRPEIKFGAGGLQITHPWTKYVAGETVEFKTTAAGARIQQIREAKPIEISSPWANHITSGRERKAQRLARSDILNTVRGQPRSYVNDAVRAVASDRRTEIQKTYAKYGLDGVASWANAANKVPVVGVYGAAAASLVIAARLPFYQGRAYAAGRNFVGDEPVPKVPTGPKWDRWWINDVAATSTKFYSNTAATSTIDYYWKTMNRWNRPHQKFTEPN